MSASSMPPPCSECGGTPVLADRKSVSKHGSGKVWRCGAEGCDTYVGCHPGTSMPLGTMAGPELRALRRRAHTAFDWSWKKGGITRSQAYTVLREEFGLTEAEAHIGMMGGDMCRRVIREFNALKPWKAPKF